MTILGSTSDVAWPASVADEIRRMGAEVRQTLLDDPPWIPCKYLYDDRGAQLFEEITTLPEYYQTRTEEHLLEEVAPEIMGLVDPLEIVELGSGAGRKIRALLDGLARRGGHARLTLIDINARSIEESRHRLSVDYPNVQIAGVVADFEHALPPLPRLGRRLLAFFAGTIGNLHPADVSAFLSHMGASLAPGDGFLIGVDLVKDKARLEAAYNDARGVTARFNLNVLQVLNDRLGADFDVDAFEHVAFFDERKSWIEMRVRARFPMRVSIPASGVTLALAEGSEIRTELSCKYTRASFAARLPKAGFVLRRFLTDADDLFALALLERTDSP
jgi:L-histidine N-alpha-methyltransferase